MPTPWCEFVYTRPPPSDAWPRTVSIDNSHGLHERVPEFVAYARNPHRN